MERGDDSTRAHLPDASALGAASNSSDAAEYRQADDDNWYTMEEFRHHYQQPCGTFGAWRRYWDRAGLASTQGASQPVAPRQEFEDSLHAREVQRLKHVRRDALAIFVEMLVETPSPAAGASTPCALPGHLSLAQDPHARLERALAESGVVRQGITRTGTEPITGVSSLSQRRREEQTPLRLLRDYRVRARSVNVCYSCHPDWIGWHCERCGAQY